MYYANDAGQGVNRGMLQKITDALNHETLFADYNAFGQPETITSPNGAVTVKKNYNLAGRLTSSTTAGITTSYEYYPDGRIKKVTGPDSRIISYDYTSAGFLEEIRDSLGNTVNYFYDSESNITREETRDSSYSLTSFLRYAYENSGRLGTATALPAKPARI